MRKRRKMNNCFIEKVFILCMFLGAIVDGSSSSGRKGKGLYYLPHTLVRFLRAGHMRCTAIELNE